MNDTTTARIRDLNDNFRSTFSGGKVVVTSAFDTLEETAKTAIFQKIQNFDNFTEDNDPYGEHDFGAVDFKGDKFFWKIDYYDLNCQHGSEDPSDPKQTSRVLTIMLAGEY